jgi:NitT/TauT family transport system ATP-binding protein
VYGILTGREEAAEQAVAASAVAAPGTLALTPSELPLPEVSAGGLSGLLEILAAKGGEEGLAELADELSFEVDDLLPLVDVAVMLGLAEVHDADLELTDQGREFATADIDGSKTLFGKLTSERVPLIKAIVKGLNATTDGTLREGFFLDLLRRGFSTDEARRQLDIAIDWGRYGELFEYDSESGQLVLDSDPAKVGA